MKYIDYMACRVMPTNLVSVLEANISFTSYVFAPPPPRNFLHSSSTMRLPYGHITAERIGKSSPAQVDEYLKRCSKTRKDSVLLETYQRHLIKKNRSRYFMRDSSPEALNE